MMFAGAAPEKVLQTFGKIHIGKPLAAKNRRALIASLRPNYLQHLRVDNGDLPPRSSRHADGFPGQRQMNFVPAAQSLRVLS
jgi:hypothetical protein